MLVIQLSNFLCCKRDCPLKLLLPIGNLQIVVLQLTGAVPFGSKQGPHHAMANSRSNRTDDLQHLQSVRQQHAEWVSNSYLIM